MDAIGGWRLIMLRLISHRLDWKNVWMKQILTRKYLTFINWIEEICYIATREIFICSNTFINFSHRNRPRSNPGCSSACDNCKWCNVAVLNPLILLICHSVCRAENCEEGECTWFFWIWLLLFPYPRRYCKIL